MRPYGYRDRKSTRLNSSHLVISYAVFCLKKKKNRLKPRLSLSKIIQFPISLTALAVNRHTQEEYLNRAICVDIRLFRHLVRTFHVEPNGEYKHVSAWRLRHSCALR